MSHHRVELTVDAGELADEPAEFPVLATLLHVACGGHAGDAASMARLASACAATGCRLGAHPSYEDRAGFGRVSIPVTPAQLEASVVAQLRALQDASGGVPAVSVKAHGALYHDVARDPALARALVAACSRVLPGVDVVGPPTGALRDAVVGTLHRYRVEGFADRAYASPGVLVPRSQPGAVLHDMDAAVKQAVSLAPHVDHLCVHGDHAASLDILRAVRAALEERGFIHGERHAPGTAGR